MPRAPYVSPCGFSRTKSTTQDMPNTEHSMVVGIWTTKCRTPSKVLKLLDSDKNWDAGGANPLSHIFRRSASIRL